MHLVKKLVEATTFQVFFLYNFLLLSFFREYVENFMSVLDWIKIIDFLLVELNNAKIAKNNWNLSIDSAKSIVFIRLQLFLVYVPHFYWKNSIKYSKWNKLRNEHFFIYTLILKNHLHEYINSFLNQTIVFLW